MTGTMRLIMNDENLKTIEQVKELDAKWRAYSRINPGASNRLGVKSIDTNGVLW